MKKTTAVVGVLLFGFASLSLEAVTPRKWQLQRYQQFLQGKFSRVSLSRDGVLSLAPREEALTAPTEEFLLSLLVTPDGTAFIGTGHAGNIYQVGKDGKAELYFHVPEMDVLCLARDIHGHLFAGTAPNGRIYRITEKGKGGEYFNPKKKYVWDLMFIDNGTLLAAVGESGGIYQIAGEGQGAMILEAQENHILCLDQTPEGDLLAGSGGRGRLYRLTKDKKPAVLFESPFEEIKDIATDDQGNIYFAAGGLVTRLKAGEPSPLGASARPGRGVSATDVTVTVSAAAPQTPAAQTAAVGAAQPGALFKIEASGLARSIWQSNDEMVYSVIWDPDGGRVIFGTGGKGRIYAVDREEKASLLLQKDSEQIYHLHRSSSGIHVLANNPSVFSVFYFEQSYDGEYLSRVYDTGLLSSWGRVEWAGDTPNNTTLQVLTRSGNSGEPSQSWSAWSPPYKKSQGEPNLSPTGRYLQFKVRFKTNSGKVSPTLEKIALFYLQANVPPRLTHLELLPVNTVFLEPPTIEERVWGFQPDALEAARKSTENRSPAMAKKAERKGYQSLVWSGQDENQDRLIYRLSIRKNDEATWRLIEDDLTDSIFAFDSMAFPDGDYRIKLEASDAPSNPAGAELIGEKISRPFVIDNSLPVIRNFEAKRSGAVIKLEFSAFDAYSRIKEARYLIRPGQWRTIFPVDGICDSRSESFQLTLTLPSGFDDMISVKVVDEHGNIGVHRSTF